MPIDINLLVQRARAVVNQARDLLKDLETAGVGQGQAEYDNLDHAIWAMEATLQAHQTGTLQTADPATPDAVPADPDMAAAMALNRPLDVLRAAVAAAEERLTV